MAGTPSPLPLMSMPGATKFTATTGSMTTIGLTTIKTRISARARDHNVVDSSSRIVSLAGFRVFVKVGASGVT